MSGSIVTRDAPDCSSLDSLPFTPEHFRYTVLCEIRRVLKDDGTAVITLPVEMGPAVLVREALRIFSGAWRDGYTLSGLMSAIRCSPVPAPSNAHTNLIGYDYRTDIVRAKTVFSIERMMFLPWHFLRWVSPTVLLVCKPCLHNRFQFEP